jgi:hypothetical protein
MNTTNMRLAAAALLLAVGTAIPGGADAQMWSTPQVAAEGVIEGFSANGTGTAALIFAQTAAGLFATVRTGGVWGPPATLTTQGTRGNIAVAPNGDVLAVWDFHLTNSTAPAELQAAFYHGGHWGSPVTLSTNGASVNAYQLAVLGFDGQSRATVIWEQITSSNPYACSLVAATGNAAGGFAPAQAIASTCLGWIELAVNTAGEAIAIQGAPTLEVAPVIATSRDSNGIWGAPVMVTSRGYGNESPNVALGNNGTAVVIWRTRVQTAVAVRENGVWTAPAVPPAVVGGGGTAAVDGNGNAVIAYGGKLSYRPAGGSFQTPIVLNGSASGVVADDAGTFAVAGSGIAVRLPGSSTWNQNGPDGAVVIASGLATAFLYGPQNPSGLYQIESSEAVVP